MRRCHNAAEQREIFVQSNTQLLASKVAVRREMLLTFTNNSFYEFYRDTIVMFVGNYSFYIKGTMNTCSKQV